MENTIKTTKSIGKGVVKQETGYEKDKAGKQDTKEKQQNRKVSENQNKDKVNIINDFYEYAEVMNKSSLNSNLQEMFDK